MATPIDVTDLSMDPSAPPSSDAQTPAPQAGDQNADEQCMNGMHYVHNPATDAFENVGSCDTTHGDAGDTGAASTAPAPEAGAPESMNTNALIQNFRQKVQGPAGGAINNNTSKSLSGLGKGAGF